MDRKAEVLHLLSRYRRAIASHDATELARLARLWTGIERNLSGEMEALAQQLYEARQTGAVITEQLLWRMERYRTLRGDLREQILRFARGDTPRNIAAGQETLARLGLSYSGDMIRAVGGGIYFHRLPIAALEAYSGMLGDGTPLYRLLSEAYPYSLDGIVKALLEGTARGMTPRAVAREMSNRMGVGLVRITRIARTEGMRAFRTSSAEQYRESGVVEDYIRCADKATACFACLELDGTHLALEEDLEDHPNGYCFTIPGLRGVEPLDLQSGHDWLMEQSEDKQRELMGDERFELWQGGMDTRDMVEMKQDEVWGNSPALVPVGELE